MVFHQVPFVLRMKVVMSVLLYIVCMCVRAQLLFSVLEEGLPFRKWNSKMLVAWLEVWVGVPFWYIAALRNCLDSGETLAVSTV